MAENGVWKRSLFGRKVMPEDLASPCKQLGLKGRVSRSERIVIFLKKPLAEVANLLDRSRSLCQKFSQLSSSFFVARLFVRTKPWL